MRIKHISIILIYYAIIEGTEESEQPTYRIKDKKGYSASQLIELEKDSQDLIIDDLNEYFTQTIEDKLATFTKYKLTVLDNNENNFPCHILQPTLGLIKMHSIPIVNTLIDLAVFVGNSITYLLILDTKQITIYNATGITTEVYTENIIDIYIQAYI